MRRRKRHEERLVRDFISHLPAILGIGAGSTVITTEMGVGRTIADVVILIGAGSSRPIMQGPLSARESAILAALRRNGPTAIRFLETRCGMPSGSLEDGKEFRRIQRWGLIGFDACGKVRISGTWTGDVVCFEAKMRDWRGALRQAKAHSAYADATFVVLPAAAAAVAASKSNEFCSAGVGLLAVGSEGIARLLPARKNKEHDWRREFAYSRLLSIASPIQRACRVLRIPESCRHQVGASDWLYH